jgi:bile acid-coenzyme A ligase
LRVAWHLAEPCPAWLKEAWIDWLGPERLWELYGGTEGQLATIITGTEWLEHRGSVGRPIGGEIMICDPEGNALPAGAEGEVWLRSARDTPAYRYVGAEARTRAGGWESLGDNGRLDADGYLYLGDRVSDMILTGGANVYPAEVEAALLEHPVVRTCAVIGLPDDDKGNRIHAVVDAGGAAVDESDLRAFLAERLVAYKLPRTLEFVDEPLRDDAGKVRRGELRADRLDEVTPPG